jgi:hypothetical protein
MRMEKAGDDHHPRAARRPEGEKEEQGARASHPTAMTKDRVGRERRPARPPPTAARRLAGLATMPRGVSEDRLRRIRTTCPRVPWGTLGRFPAEAGIGLRNRRSDGLSAMPGLVPDCSPRLLA